MPGFYNATINIALNEDWVVSFDYAVATTNGSEPIDLSGSVLKMQIRESATDHEALVSVCSPASGGIAIVNASQGAFQITLSRSEIALLSPGVAYVTDLVRILPSGNREIIFDGSVTVEEGVTR